MPRRHREAGDGSAPEVPHQPQRRGAQGLPRHGLLPTAKELANFDFAASPVNEPLIQELAGGGFLEGKRNIVLVGGTSRAS